MAGVMSEFLSWRDDNKAKNTQSPMSEFLSWRGSQVGTTGIDLSAAVDEIEKERESNNSLKQLTSWATTPQGKISDRINTDATNLLEKRKQKSETQAKVKELDNRLTELSDSGDINGAYTLEKERDRLKNQLKYGNANYQEDDLSDQFAVGYGLTRLSQDASHAAATYLDVPTEENWKAAVQARNALEEYQKRNQKVLDARGKNSELVQTLQSWWANVPQQIDQAGAGIQGALVGAGAGSIIPGIGTVSGLKYGYVAGSSAESYNLMRGSVFMDLVSMGVDKEIARKAATDEAVISAAIESLDTMLDVTGLGLGFGSIVAAAEKGALKLFAKEGMEKAAESAGKKLLKSLGKYGLNIVQESLEEGTQQAVSIANRERFMGDAKTQGTPAMQDNRLSSIGELAGKSLLVGAETIGAVAKGELEPTNIYEELALAGVSPDSARDYLMAAKGYDDNQARAAAMFYEHRYDELQTWVRKVSNAMEIGEAAKEGARIAAVSGIVQPVFNTAVQTGIAVAGSRLAAPDRTMPQFKDEAKPSPLPDSKQVAKDNVPVKTSETVARMNETAQKAVADAQAADFGDSVKADNTTVLDKASTLYASQLGVTAKVANTKAAVVQKVVNGENITLGELGKLDLTNPKSRAVFTELTGFQFPENTKALENRQYQLSLMKQVPGVMTERAELSNTVQQTQQMSRKAVAEAQAARVELTAEEVQATSATPAQVTPAAETGIVDIAQFGQRYREQMNPQAGPEEISEAYQAYRKFESDSFEENGKTISREEFARGMKATESGAKLSDEAINQYFDYYRDAAKARSKQQATAKAEGSDLRASLAEPTRRVIENVERKLGIKIIVERKVAGPAGKKIRGSNNSKLREIHIAIDASGDLSHGDVILQVLRHELTHHLRSTSPKSFEAFKDLVVREMDDYESRYAAKAKAYSGVIDADSKSRIDEELVAEYSEKLFTDEEFIDMIARTDRSLAEKILDSIKHLIGRLTGDEMSEARATVEKAQRLWEKALEKAVVKTDRNGTVTNYKGEPIAQHNDGVTQFSMRTYEEHGREYLNNWLAKAVDRGDLTQEEADDICKQMDGIYEICQKYRGEYGPFGAWSDAAVVVDENGKPVFSVVKSNGDYALNLDFSLVCKKRRTLDAVLNAMVKSGVINEFNIGEKEIVQINDIIRNHGFEVACAMCFVDAKRFKQGKVADTFVSMYNGLVKSLVPKGSGLKVGHFNFGGNDSLSTVDGGIDTLADDMLDFSKLDKVMSTQGEKTVPYKIAQHLKNNPGDRKLMDRGDLMSTAGFDALKTRNPDLLKIYNAKKGTGGPKAAFGDVQYLSEILSSRSFNVESAYPVGGVRVQSFSDYMPRMVFDYVQMIGDLAAKKLPAHAYTKEELFVKQFGLTGMKINMSLIPRVDENGIAPGLDADGNYVWSDESFDYDTAVEIQNAEGYSENCGTICVGVSNEHIRTLMKDDNIRMVIPYHKSSLNPTVARMNHISEFTDYTGCQSTRRPTGGVDKKTGAQSGKKLDKKVAADKKLMDAEPQFNVILREVEDPYKASEIYVRWCEDNNLLPKFDQFAYRQIDGEYVVNDEGKRVVDENYYKLLEDFTVSVDGEYKPQTGVRAIFPGENDAFGPMKDLIARGLEEDAIAEGKRDSEVPKIVKEIRETLGGKVDENDYSFDEDNFNLDDFTIDDLMLEISDDILLEDDFNADDFIDDISGRLNAEPETVRILFRRSGLGDSHVAADRMAVMTQARIDQRIGEHGAGNTDYARRYVTRISPKDFIDMTVYESNRDRENFDNKVLGDLDGKMSDWDYAKQLHDSKEPPVLVIDKSTGQIISHNGRHRVRALEIAGIESVEIEVELHDEDGYLIKYGAETIPDLAIYSQFDTAIETHLSNIIPLNKSHRSEIMASYGETAHADAGVQYAIEDDVATPTEGEYNAVRELQSNFDGTVAEGPGVKLSKTTKAKIASAILSGNFIMDDTGELGRVNVGKTCYMFSPFDDGAVYVFKSKTQKEINAMTMKYRLGGNYGRNRRTGSNPAGTRSTVPVGSKYRTGSIRRSGRDGRLVEQEPGSYQIGDGAEGAGYERSSDLITYSPDYAHWRNRMKEGMGADTEGDSFSLEPDQMEADLSALKQERSDIEEQLDMAFFNDLSDVEVRRLNNRLVKVNAEIDKIVAEERRASVLTPMQTILDNLGNYRRSDLNSLALQISDSAWDDYEELSRPELEDALREAILGRELSSLEMQTKKFGLYVRPPKDVKNRYALEPDTLREDFVKSFDAQFGEGAAEAMFRTHEQMKRAAQRAGVKAKTTEESAAAERALAKQRLENRMTAWEIHHKKTIRDIQRKYADKAAQERKAKAEAIADTKLVERAKADIIVQATEMNLGKKAAERERTLQERMAKQKSDAAERLRVTKSAYQGKLAESNKLHRNAAKRLLSDAAAVERRRKEIETAQGPINTIRKNPRERVKVEKMKAAADSLRTLGRTAYRSFVNRAQEIDSFAKRQRGGVYASTLVNILGGSGSTADRIFKNGLVDRSGNKIADSLKDVLLCMDATGKKVDESKQALLQDYMLHLHNVDRMSFVANALAALDQFEADHFWLKNLDTKELAKLVALTDAEVADSKVDGRTGNAKRGQNGWTEADRKLAWEYAQLLENYRNAEDKPVFADENGNPVTAETSREIVAKYEDEHDWLADKATGVFEWWDLFMRNWAVGDSLSLAEYESMRQTYPHYVPTYRVGKGGPGGAGSVSGNSASVSKATKAAKGSTLEIVNIEDSFANIASKIIRLARTNELYMNIIDTAMLDEEGLFSDMAVFDWDWQTGAYGDTLQMQALLNGETASEIEESTKVGLRKDGPNFRLSGWKDGRVYSAVISKDLFDSIAEVTGYADEKFKRLTKIGNTLTGPMKTAITGVNPFFAVRNLSRDIPTAIINSTGAKFPKYWARAINEIRTNSDNWQVFQSLGGVHSGYYNNENGFAAALAQGEGVVATGLDKLGALNNVTEAATRFAEYLSTVDRMGDTYEARMQGVKNSAEVTVDFSRKGSYGQLINAWVPYWNPAVQGIDKLIRSVADAPDGAAILKQAAKTGGRAMMNTVLLEGILFAVIHALDRDEEWDELSDRDKAQYYCIPLPGEHKFLKIAKNREWGAILGTPFMLTLEGLDGRQNPFENYVETSLEPNFLPGAILRPREGGGFTSDIIGVSQALDLAYNEDFAGRTIIPYALQQGSLTEQYDSETSVLSRALGDLLNFSPMQIDYIIKDYFGDFGETFVNLTAPATWASDKTPADFVASTWDTFAGSFVTDNRYSNQTVSTYYETLDALDRVVNDKKNQMGVEAYKTTKEYKIQKGMDELYGKQITDLNKKVRGLPDGPDKDALKEEIVQLAGAAMDYYKQSMSGEIAEPLLTATYANLPESVSNELIRLDNFAEDYAFAPTDYKPSAYTDPRNSRREYVLDDEAKDMYRTIYDQQYAEVMSETMGKARYRKANDQKKAELLEDARDTVTERTKDDFLDWLAKNRRSTEKSK